MHWHMDKQLAESLDCRFHWPPGLQLLSSLQRLELIAESTLMPLPRELGLLTNLKSLHVEMEVAGGYASATNCYTTSLV